MTGVATVVDHGHVRDKAADPLGIRARIKAHGYTQREFGSVYGFAPNTITDVIHGEASAEGSRQEVLRILNRLDDERGSSMVDAPSGRQRATLDRLVGDEDKVLDTRVRWSRSGRSRMISVFLADPDLSEDELAEEERRWREGDDRP